MTPKPGTAVLGDLWKPLVNHSAPGSEKDKNLIVLHITEGPTALSAWNTFFTSVPPNRVSSHFIIDRDAKGTVWQCVSMADIAWHASAVNERSIGIEHAAIHDKLPVTEAQYRASARLVARVANRLSIPLDRQHVVSHYEASPKDGHVLCCQPTLDVDRVVAMALKVSV